MKYVLFTGITGELGIAVAASIKGMGQFQPACMIRRDAKEYKVDLNGFKVLRGDICDMRSLLKHADELKGEVDTIVHMASSRHGSSSRELYDTIVKGSLNMYDLADRIGCGKFIYLSSILAVGGVSRGMQPIDETFKPSGRALSLFGKMKLMAERELLKKARSGVTKVIVLRLGNVYGPPTKLSFIRFVSDMLKDKKKLLYCRARHSVMWAPVFIKDVIDCIFLLVRKKSFDNGVYFLTGPEQPTLETLTGLIKEKIGLSIDLSSLGSVECAGLGVRKTADRIRSVLGYDSFPNFIYSNKKIGKELGFYPKTGVAEGVPATIEYAISKGML